jgi:protein-S-isoprenylcysteine O-methyltransferase Ste14
VSAVRLIISIGWLTFVLYWWISALNVKRGTRMGPLRGPGIVVVVVVVVLRLLGVDGAAVDDLGVGVAGAVIVVAGLGWAVWARVALGRNWGMPMTRKEEPELVTKGPYRVVRHPVYSGLLLALLGTALATYTYLFIVVAVLAAYFLYSATVEERFLQESFPGTYASYRARTKMLIPFVL